MSSTTSALIARFGSIRSRRSTMSREGGQVLVLFAGGVLALLIVAALAFDVGMMLLERRDQQNAADAAALAGARYIFDADCDASTAWACARARDAAIDVALANGFDDAALDESVTVHIPAVHGRFDLLPNFLEVEIDTVRPSIFAGVIGRAQWPVGVFAVATNDNDLTFPFSMLALNETACKAIHIAGTGLVDANGNVQSNSNGADCAAAEGGNWGLSRTGGGTLNINTPDATCRAAGDIQDSGASGDMNCTQAPNSFALPDPLADLDPPTKPALAAPMIPIGHSKAIPNFCPGSTSRPPTETAAQRTCEPGGGSPSSQYRDLAWVLSPGLYPDGLNIRNGNKVYLLPGVYWIGGGGFQVDGTGGSTATVMSIATVADANNNPALVTAGGGVLIYNSQLSSVPIAPGPVSLGSGGGRLILKMLNLPTSDPNHIYNDMSIWQDRDVTETVTFNGSSAASEVEGIVYVPSGHLVINGSSSTFTLDQVIADTFKINGNGGTIEILKRVGIDAIITAAGLVD